MTSRSDAWEDRAECKGAPGDLFFPPDDLHPQTKEYAEHVAHVTDTYCARCPVRGECLRAGLNEDFGIWGGLSPQDRAHLRKRMK